MKLFGLTKVYSHQINVPIFLMSIYLYTNPKSKLTLQITFFLIFGTIIEFLRLEVIKSGLYICKVRRVKISTGVLRVRNILRYRSKICPLNTMQ